MDISSIIVTFHLIGFAFGVGGATASDLTFVHSTKDGKVTNEEFKLIKVMSLLVWTAVAILVASGAIAMLYQYSQIGEIPRLGWSWFQLKMLVFAILVTNGLVFHFKIFPLIKSSIDNSFRVGEIRAKYWLFGLTGAISIVSWYTAFLLVAFKALWINYEFIVLTLGYLSLIPIAAIGAYSTLVLNSNDGDKKATLREIARSRFVRGMVIAALTLMALLTISLAYFSL